MSKFKVGDKVRVVRNNGDDFGGVKIGDTGKVVDITEGKDYSIYLKINNHDEYGFKEEELELFEGVEEMKELTFKEVIANIKEGEVWESDYKTVEIKGSVLEITDKDRKIRLRFGDDTQFKLQRKEYTFEEAFKAYEEGKEVESKSWRYKKIHGKDSVCSKDNDEWVTSKFAAIDIKEIRGKWYIND